MTSTGQRGEYTTDDDSRTNAPASAPRWRVIPPLPPRRPPGGGGGLRTWVALRAGRFATALSRRFALGSGGMIGGRVAMALDPDVLGTLVQDKQVVMVTGTNGKTTTTHMVAEALRAGGAAVSNATGANMLDGHVAALMSGLSAPYAALEVDELHLAQVTGEFEPAAIVLLNLSRDQLDRVGEIRSVEASLRRALLRVPGTRVIANADDPNIVSAAADHPRVTWVAGGCRWKHDALNCPRCGAFLGDLGAEWGCRCGLARPRVDWTVDAEGVVGPDGRRDELALCLPGQVNRVNAMFALAAALQVGGDRAGALARIRVVEHASGRYGRVWLDGHAVRLLLAKNPASWLEMLDLVAEHRRPLILVVNSQEADGYDVSWLWDIDFESLAGRDVTVTGQRALDLAVRLRYAEVDCRVCTDVGEALRSGNYEQPPEVIANYTAFRDLFAKSLTSSSP